MNMLLRRLILILKVWKRALLAPAADPRGEFASAHEQYGLLLNRVQQARAGVEASRQKLEAGIGEAREKPLRYEERARKELLAGSEQNARHDLRLRQVAQRELLALEGHLADVHHEGQQLALVEHRLTAEIATFIARQEALEARHATALAQVPIGQALAGVSQELAGLGQALENAEQTAEDMEARVSAISQLEELGVLESQVSGMGDSVLPQLAAASDSHEVDEKLAALKRELEAG